MAQRSKREVQYPLMLQYANEQQRFAAKTLENIHWAWKLMVNFLSPKHQFRDEQVWCQLRTHQAEFRRFLDGLISRNVTPAQMEMVNEHHGHHRTILTWYPWPTDSAVEEEDPSDPPPSVASYGMELEIQEALDVLYSPVAICFSNNTFNYLHKCPVCDRYFLARTARRQIYCTDRCRLKNNPIRREQNARYQSRHREKIIKQDLEKVKAAKE
jgi:hypothetical protein